MAFTGTPVIEQVADGICRITGVSLAGAAAGQIALSGHAAGPDVLLPAAFAPGVYGGPGGAVSLQASIEVDTKNAATGIATPVPIATVKTGTSPTDFLITVTNLTSSTASPNLEIYVKFHI